MILHIKDIVKFIFVSSQFVLKTTSWNIFWISMHCKQEQSETA